MILVNKLQAIQVKSSQFIYDTRYDDKICYNDNPTGTKPSERHCYDVMCKPGSDNLVTVAITKTCLFKYTEDFTTKKRKFSEKKKF